ncbi:MAG: S-methyl-5-thioribose-1-phosphate isomerase, partial [Candidatus Acidiferrales bacterium]
MEPIRWTSEGVVILDQRLLPGEVVYRTYTDYREVARSIKEMEIRGAPAIGVAAAMGVALGILHSQAKTMGELRAEFAVICDALGKTRPTAVDLFWAIRRFERRFAKLAGESATCVPEDELATISSVRVALVDEAQRVHQERKDADESIGRLGAELLPKGAAAVTRVMTQCNAGALATGGMG